MSGIVTGKQACELAFAGVGMAFGAIASGVSGTGPATGGMTTLAAMLGGAAVGYICGRLVCRFAPFRKVFDKQLDLDGFEAEVGQVEMLTKLLRPSRRIWVRRMPRANWFW